MIDSLWHVYNFYANSSWTVDQSWYSEQTTRPNNGATTETIEIVDSSDDEATQSDVHTLKSTIIMIGVMKTIMRMLLVTEWLATSSLRGNFNLAVVRWLSSVKLLHLFKWIPFSSIWYLRWWRILYYYQSITHSTRMNFLSGLNTHAQNRVEIYGKIRRNSFNSSPRSSNSDSRIMQQTQHQGN